ncbi:hypothetical protein F967_01374 [Acinetobacter sp. CIP 102637]|nr:hypothetical protein F973_00571 [Acinetobacter sp. CIP 102129]ENV06403.1 hypothetical protein F967_01374 [Acinetobacter sp. CIP 102637]
MRKALTEALKYLPAELRKTLTYDRGGEMAEHKTLEEDLGIDVYFCDPHSPWQKGTCENMNGLIRQYLPKGIDLNQAFKRTFELSPKKYRQQFVEEEN